MQLVSFLYGWFMCVKLGGKNGGLDMSVHVKGSGMLSEKSRERWNINTDLNK